MKDNISFLTIEDIPVVSQGIEERIINEFGVKRENVNCFYFADEAITFLKKNTPNIIIVDLAMDPVGLPIDEQNATNNSRLTGWVILKKYVFDGEFKERLKDAHCYIFSGYGRIFSSVIGINSINNSIDIIEINMQLKNIRNNLYFVPKVGTDGGAAELIKMIKKHSNCLF